jgi:hypothetical protein
MLGYNHFAEPNQYVSRFLDPIFLLLGHILNSPEVGLITEQKTGFDNRNLVLVSLPKYLGHFNTCLSNN